MGQDQPPEPGLLAHGGEQTSGHADVGTVEHQHERRQQAEGDAAGEGEDRHLHVVGEDLGRELAGRSRAVIVLEVVVDVRLADGLRPACLDGGG